MLAKLVSKFLLIYKESEKNEQRIEKLAWICKNYYNIMDFFYMTIDKGYLPYYNMVRYIFAKKSVIIVCLKDTCREKLLIFNQKSWETCVLVKIAKFL